MILFLFLAAVILIWVYILFVREWLAHESPWASYFQWLHALEDTLWDRSRTILVGRAYWLGGIVIALQSLITEAGIDTTPLLTEVGKLIPEQWRSLALGLFLFATGIAITWLRKRTTKALGE